MIENKQNGCVEKIAANTETRSDKAARTSSQPKNKQQVTSTELKKEINGPKGLEPTRYGDWESKGRCYDF